MGMIGVLEITLIVPTLQRVNAAQDAPRPRSNVTQNECLPQSCVVLREQKSANHNASCKCPPAALCRA